MKKTRRIKMIAIPLCLAILAMAFTTVVLAAGETENVANAEELSNALSSGKNVTLTQNITSDSSITITQPVEINLSGHTITTTRWGTIFDIRADVTIKGSGTIQNGDGASSSPTSSAVAVKVSKNATLTIQDTTIQAGKTVTSGSTSGINKAIYVAGGHVILKNATVIGGDSEGKAAAAEAIYLQFADDTLTATDSTITGGNAVSTDSNASGGAAIRMQSSATVNLTNCTVTGGSTASSNFAAKGGTAVWVQNNGTLLINGGALSGGAALNSGVGGNAVWMQNSGVLTIDGATINGGEAKTEGEGGDAINLQSGSITTEITNATVTGGNAVGDYAGSGITASRNINSGSLNIQNSQISAGNGPGWSADPFGLDMGVYNLSNIPVTIRNSTVSGGENGMAVGVSNQSITSDKVAFDNVLTKGKIQVGKTGGGSAAATKEELTAMLSGTSTDVCINDEGLIQFGGTPNEDTPDIRPVYNKTQNKYYGSLKAAVDAAAEGNVLEISAGTLTEDTTVVINKSLTIQGAGKESTTIKSAKAGAILKVIYKEGVEINLSGLTLDGSNVAGILTWSADSAYAQTAAPQNMPVLNVHDCIFTNTRAPKTGAAIGLWDTGNKLTAAASNVNIQSCTFTNLMSGIYFSEESPLLNLRAVIDGNLFTELSWGGIVGIPANADIKNNNFDSTVGTAIQYLLNSANKQSATSITNNIIDSAIGIEFMPYHWAEGYSQNPDATEKIEAGALPSIKENVRNTDTDLVTLVAYRAGTDEAAILADNALDISRNYTAGKQATVKVTMQNPAEGKEAPALDEVTPVVYDTEYYLDADKTDLKSEITGISLNKSQITLEEGGNEQLTATVLPDNAVDKTVAWKSSDEAIVKVDASGKITAVAEGKATITASAGGFTASCEITVTAAKYSDKTDDGDAGVALTAVGLVAAALAAAAVTFIYKRKQI